MAKLPKHLEDSAKRMLVRVEVIVDGGDIRQDVVMEARRLISTAVRAAGGKAKVQHGLVWRLRSISPPNFDKLKELRARREVV